MRINEIEKLLDVPASLIRFYEREGLLNPVRLENGYRDYSEAEINYPLYCPKCKQEVLVEAKNLKVKVIKEPDAKPQSR